MIRSKNYLLAVFTDITRLMELEKQGRVLRAQFFSSIAHELRTPLNSIIPVLTLVLSMLAQPQVDINKITTLLRIVRNSSIHLENVVNDALDITRIENHKFEIFKSTFKIRETVQEVCEIMRFQFDEKRL